MARVKSEFVSAFDIAASIFKSLSNGVIDAGGCEEQIRMLETDSELRRKVGELIANWGESAQINVADNLQDVLADWTTFWQMHGFELDTSKLVIPAKREGFNRLIVIPQGLLPQKAYEICKSMFSCWTPISEDLDELVVHEDRTAKDGSYARWFRERVEADQELKNLSANQLSERNISGITLTERLVFEAKYFSEKTGKHLDTDNWTLCSGSRFSKGNVPCVCWDSTRAVVGWDEPQTQLPFLRSRQVAA